MDTIISMNPIIFSQYFSHAVVHAVRDKAIRKEILEIYRNIKRPKERQSDNVKLINKYVSIEHFYFMQCIQFIPDYIMHIRTLSV